MIVAKPKYTAVLTTILACLSPASPAEEILFNATFETSSPGHPPIHPDGDPEFDTFAYGSGFYSVVTDPSDPLNQILEAYNFFDEANVLGLLDPTFDASLPNEDVFEISWSSSVATNTRASISISNGSTTIVFLRYNPQNKRLYVSDALSQAADTGIAYLANQPQHFHIRVDFKTGTFALFVDDLAVGDSLPLIAGAPKGITDIEFQCKYAPPSGGGFPFAFNNSLPVGAMQLDNLQVKRIRSQKSVEANFKVYSNTYHAKKSTTPNKAIPALILGSEGLDVSTIALDTLRLNGAPIKKTRSHPLAQIIDASGPDGKPDGYPDLLCKFTPSAEPPSTPTLEGTLDNGDLLEGVPLD